MQSAKSFEQSVLKYVIWLNRTKLTKKTVLVL